MSLPFAVFVRGIARPKGSKRAFIVRRKVTGRLTPIMAEDAGENLEAWSSLISFSAQERWQGPPVEGPLVMALEFVFPWPKSWSARKRKENRFRTSAPDRGKLARAVEDALEGIVYLNDAQVCDGPIVKRYGDEPGVHITIDALWPLKVPERQEEAASRTS